MEIVDWKKSVTANEPFKALAFGRKRNVGRNSVGQITTRHKGGGVKRLWREVDFRYDTTIIHARVETLEYAPNRSSFIALV